MAQLKAPILTFLSLFLVVNGFLALVWLANSGADPGKGGIPVAPGETLPALLFILGLLFSWGLFVGIFRTLTRVSLDQDRLTEGRSGRHRPHRHPA